MLTLALIVVLTGVAPFLAALARLRPTPAGVSAWPTAGAVLLCTLAFNLTFFWQELWLVLPKAMTPGLHPVLFHNDHDWTGTSPLVDLLQGTGAIATLASGLAALAALCLTRRGTPTWRLFLFWMAFQGLYQSGSQVLIGAFFAHNDVGRALHWLGLGQVARLLLAGVAMALLLAAGRTLAQWLPAGLLAPRARGTRATAWALFACAAGCTLLSVPFREPRDAIEVVLIPAIVNLLGAASVACGAVVPWGEPPGADARPGVAWPLAVLLVLLALFQGVLRPGVHF